ncbi:hypothetical protein BPT24_123 [Tenacibaculum phage pT24]|uniref:Uncharacterized protein n=1 Tax=Tenacibaculum phage pT24 TaxID=1880590 RepID=A0A1B4XWR5_9CAUD|nr:hypothetical protein HYP10_gp123 [Tenacibaculum phage pT24]BAV39248.1 hypothetical protein BPT24_123 [Tenacibaculum phage pT24]
MAGYNNTKVRDLKVSFQRTNAEPIDKYDNISALDQIDTQLPESIRYDGMLVYVENIRKYYFFDGGITNSDFKPVINFQGTKTFEATVDTVASTIIEVEHNLGTVNIMGQFMHDDESLLISWKRGKVDGTERENYIHFATNSDYTDLDIILVGKDVDGVISNDPALTQTLSGMYGLMSTTHTALNDFQKMGDALVALGALAVPHEFPYWDKFNTDSDILGFGLSWDNSILLRKGASSSDNRIEFLTEDVYFNTTREVIFGNNLRIINSRALQFLSTDGTTRHDLDGNLTQNSSSTLPPHTSQIYGVTSSNVVPTPTSEGVMGEIRIIGNYKYECIDTDEWIRTLIERTW